MKIQMNENQNELILEKKDYDLFNYMIRENHQENQDHYKEDYDQSIIDHIIDDYDLEEIRIIIEENDDIYNSINLIMNRRINYEELYKIENLKKFLDLKEFSLFINEFNIELKEDIDKSNNYNYLQFSKIFDLKSYQNLMKINLK